MDSMQSWFAYVQGFSSEFKKCEGHQNTVILYDTVANKITKKLMSDT